MENVIQNEAIERWFLWQTKWMATDYTKNVLSTAQPINIYIRCDKLI